MLMAIQFHARRHESTEAWLGLLLLALTVFVAYVSWPLLP